MSDQKELPICGDELQIIYREDGLGNKIPELIRDRGGMLCSFRKVFRYPDQHDRYLREVNQLKNLALFMLNSLENYNQPLTERPS